MAKQNSYAIRIWRRHMAGLKRVLDLHLASSKLPDISVEVRGAIGFQPLQDSGEPAFKARTDRRELSLDGCFGEVIRGDSSASAARSRLRSVSSF
jgi:hypothetical protein